MPDPASYASYTNCAAHCTGRAATRGFTLIELVIVIAIISILAGIAVVGIQSAIQSGKEGDTRSLITQLKGALAHYESDRGQFPPVNLEAFRAGFIDPNSTNTGIETLVLCLRRESDGGGAYLPFESFANKATNHDKDDEPDAYDFLGIDSTNYELFELSDSWGNPLFYVQSDFYEDDAWLPFEIEGLGGQIIDVTPQRLSTGTYPAGFMIYSFGGDLEDNNGEGDDLVSWGKN